MATLENDINFKNGTSIVYESIGPVVGPNFKNGTVYVIHFFGIWNWLYYDNLMRAQ